MTQLTSLGRRIRAVLLDLDGTLVDSYVAIQRSVNHVRELHSLPPMTTDEVRRVVGHGVLRLMQTTVPGADVESCVQEFLRHHPSVVGEGTRPFPRVAETLGALHAAGLRLAVCSNKPLILTQTIVETLHWRRWFGAVLGPESAARPKPAPDMLIVAMQLLGVSTSETLYVGDMSIDVETARNAGLPVWVIPTGSHTREELFLARPDRVLQQFSQLLELI